MKTSIAYCFPDVVTPHKVTFENGSRLNLFVSPSETFGHALRRAGYSLDDVKQVDLQNVPMHYEPDYAIATR